MVALDGTGIRYDLVYLQIEYKIYTSKSKTLDPKCTIAPSSFFYFDIIRSFNDGLLLFVLFSIPAIYMYGGMD